MLLEQDLPKLEKLVKKGKNVTKEIMDDRTAKASAAISRSRTEICGMLTLPFQQTGVSATAHMCNLPFACRSHS